MKIQTRGNKLKGKARWAAGWILFCLFLGVASSFLANDLPLYASYRGESYFPAFAPLKKIKSNSPDLNTGMTVSQVDWKNISEGFILWPLVPYSPESSDLLNTGFSAPSGEQHFKNSNDSVTTIPLRYRHWLGTTQTGNDVLSGIIHGARISLSIGFFAMLLAGIIGIATGAVSGYTGDKGLRLSRGVLWSMLFGIIPSFFYSFYLREISLLHALQEGYFSFLISFLGSLFLFVASMLLFCALGKVLGKWKPLARRIHFPLDIILSRVTEVFSSLPRLILIITLSALTKPSLVNLVLIFGLTGWTDIARIIRAEMLKIKSSDYVQIAIAQGIPTQRIILRHALPNIIQPAMVSILFGVAGVILAESALSFLGIGVPFNTVTWGSLVASGKENFDAWWVVLFPGLAIFFTIASLNILADEMRR